MKIKILLSLFTLSTLVVLGVLLQQSSLLQGMFRGGFDGGEMTLDTEDATAIVHVSSRASETTSISSAAEIEYTLGVWKIQADEDVTLKGFSFFIGDIVSTSSDQAAHVSSYFSDFNLEVTQASETVENANSDTANFGSTEFDLTSGETYTLTLKATSLESGVSDLYDSGLSGKEVGLVISNLFKSDGTQYQITDEGFTDLIENDTASTSGRIEYTWGGYTINASIYVREEESLVDNLADSNNIEGLIDNKTYTKSTNTYDIANDGPLTGVVIDNEDSDTDIRTGLRDTNLGSISNDDEETVADEDEDGEEVVINNDEEDNQIQELEDDSEEEDESESDNRLEVDEDEEAEEGDGTSELESIERDEEEETEEEDEETDEEEIEDEEETEEEDRFELDDTVAEEDADDEESEEEDEVDEEEVDEEEAEDAEEEEDSTNEKSCDDSFVDTRGHWAEDAICLLFSQNIVDGKDTNYYAPNEYVTKAEFLKMILLNAGYELDYDLSVSKYNDVSPSDWFYYYVALADSMQDLWFSGDSIWSPNSYITRGDAILLTVRISNKTLYGYDESDIPFTDVDASSYQTYAIILGEQYGAIEGYTDGTFRPNDKITRAEAAILTIRSSSLFR